MKKITNVPGSHPPGRRRWGRAQQAPTTDPYKARGKPPEPTICPQCQAVFHDGRWRWGPPPPGAHQTLCPACHRIADKFPAGTVTLAGTFLPSKKAEILHLAHHQEEAEKAEHPLDRIMSIDESSDAIVINTTDIHLPRRIGEALKRAFQGKLDVAFEKDGYFVRVNWHRDA